MVLAKIHNGTELLRSQNIISSKRWTFKVSSVPEKEQSAFKRSDDAAQNATSQFCLDVLLVLNKNGAYTIKYWSKSLSHVFS